MKGKLAFGGASLSADGGGYGFGSCDDPKDLVDYAYEQGITFFDTAPIYGFGKSEETLGRCLKNYREKAQLISKAGVSWHNNGRVNMSNDPKIVTQMLEDSLRRLDSDYIDIYMIHWPDKKVDIRFSLEVLAKAQVQGKIKSIGLCNTHNEDLNKAKEVCSIEYIQSELNLFNNGFLDLNLKNEKTMGWGTLDKGLLAGTVKANRVFEKDDARSWAPWWKKSNWKDKASFVKECSFDVMETAIHYSLDQMDYSLVGAKTIKQLKQCLAKSQIRIDEAEFKNRYQYFESFS